MSISGFSRVSSQENRYLPPPDLQYSGIYRPLTYSTVVSPAPWPTVQWYLPTPDLQYSGICRPLTYSTVVSADPWPTVQWDCSYLLLSGDIPLLEDLRCVALRGTQIKERSTMRAVLAFCMVSNFQRLWILASTCFAWGQVKNSMQYGILRTRETLSEGHALLLSPSACGSTGPLAKGTWPDRQQ